MDLELQFSANVARFARKKSNNYWFSICTLGGASKLFVYKQSSLRSQFAKNLISIDFELQFSTHVARFARRNLISIDFELQCSANIARFARQKSNFYGFSTSTFN